jgi:hypothetical protein
MREATIRIRYVRCYAADGDIPVVRIREPGRDYGDLWFEADGVAGMFERDSDRPRLAAGKMDRASLLFQPFGADAPLFHKVFLHERVLWEALHAGGNPYGVKRWLLRAYKELEDRDV